jgi:Sigma-70 region 2
MADAQSPLTASSDDDERDRHVVGRAREGDQRALEDLVGRHQRWIYNLAIRMLGHPQDAHDATQEVMVKVVTSRRPPFLRPASLILCRISCAGHRGR